MDSRIIKAVEELFNMTELSLISGEIYCDNLNKQLLEVTSKLIKNKFTNEEEKLDRIKIQSYITGELEEINKRIIEIKNYKYKINGFKQLVEFLVKQEKEQ